MNQVLEREAPGASVPSARGNAPRSRAVPALLQILAMIGLGALLYSSAADWFATLHHRSEISGYAESVEQLPSAEREAAMLAAREYNAHLPQGALHDPYGDTAAETQRDAAYAAYEDVLRVSDNGVIGRLGYPRLDINLPIYHGTGEDSLRRGIGHLYGSSVAVGGLSTHAVLTSHSGLLNAKLLSGLHDARKGDVFHVDVLGETLYYEVDSIETVEPEDTESLRIVNGEDRVTIFTCTPIGINSHRLLVHAVRTDGPHARDRQVIAGDGRAAGFPWWAVGFVAGSGIVAYLLFAPPRRRGTRPADQADPAPDVEHSATGTIGTTRETHQ